MLTTPLEDAVQLLTLFRQSPAALVIPTPCRQYKLFHGITLVIRGIENDKLSPSQVRPLLHAALAGEEDYKLWDLVDDILIATADSLSRYDAADQTSTGPSEKEQSSTSTDEPVLQNTAHEVATGSVHPQSLVLLRNDFPFVYMDIPALEKTLFGGMKAHFMSKAFFDNKCLRRKYPSYCNGRWTNWPDPVTEGKASEFLRHLVNQLGQWRRSQEGSEGHVPQYQLEIGVQHEVPETQEGATHKLSANIVSDSPAYYWSRLLVPGMITSDPSYDRSIYIWSDLARLAVKMFHLHGIRRWIVGFTLCGPIMRIWLFNRSGSFASTAFDINQNPHRFLSVLLSILMSDRERLGIDPTIHESPDGVCSITIQHKDQEERLILQQSLASPRYVTGQATTCWKAKSNKDLSNIYVVKECWKRPYFPQEGDISRAVTAKGVQHVVQHHYHETVRLQNGNKVNTHSGLRGVLHIDKGVMYEVPEFVPPDNEGPLRNHGEPLIATSSTDCSPFGTSSTDPPPSTTATIAPRNGIWGPEVPMQVPDNREQRRLICRGYGQPIYYAKTPLDLLRALEACIQGHESLWRAGYLHRDISINNLLVTDGREDSLAPGFLIDLDWAIPFESTSTPNPRIGTRCFKAIPLLLGQKHYFVQDVEACFWVVLTIIVASNGPGDLSSEPDFVKQWLTNCYLSVAQSKLDIVDPTRFPDLLDEYVTAYYQPLKPCITKLASLLFPDGSPLVEADLTLYAEVTSIIRQACQDLESSP